LRLSNNRLSKFDAGVFPSLTLLYLDKNCLSMVDGLGRCTHLEVLSLREQTSLQATEPAPVLHIDIGDLKDIRKLFLSSNRLSERILSPSMPALNLQLLDIAACGLDGLPTHFGKSFPNLRVLNLNFNALTELAGMAGMNGLGRLTLVGNRVRRLRTLCQIISKLGRTGRYDHSSLKTIDLRGNPLTVGFYPPAVLGSGNNTKKLESTRKRADSQEGQDENRHTALATFGHCADIALPDLASELSKIDSDPGVEIDDPYTIPPADVEADRKYRTRLDESTRVRRMVLELMLYAGSGGAIRVLDGLQLRPILEDEKAAMDRVWDKLEDLGVLKKKAGVF
jgi:Leucine-rich repeat (LRR) protein